MGGPAGRAPRPRRTRYAFAAGNAACFGGALAFAGKKHRRPANAVASELAVRLSVEDRSLPSREHTRSPWHSVRPHPGDRIERGDQARRRDRSRHRRALSGGCGSRSPSGAPSCAARSRARLLADPLPRVPPNARALSADPSGSRGRRRYPTALRARGLTAHARLTALDHCYVASAGTCHRAPRAAQPL